MFTFNITENLEIGRRLIAKVALGAGAFVGGRTFVESPLAFRLRDVMWAEIGVDRGIHAESLTTLDEMMSDALTRAGVAQIPALGAPPTSNSIVFTAVDFDSVCIFVFLHNLNIGYSGLVLDGKLPFGSGLPVQVVDSLPGPRIRKVVEDLAAVLNGRAPQEFK